MVDARLGAEWDMIAALRLDVHTICGSNATLEDLNWYRRREVMTRRDHQSPEENKAALRAWGREMGLNPDGVSVPANPA